jgi:hypothetical protein
MYAKLNGAKYCLTIASQCLALLFLLTGCVNDPEYKVYVLPSGKEIKIIGIKYGTFTDSDSLLILNYLTDIPIDNEKALRAEAEEIWPHFAVEVERANLTVGMLNAQTPSKKAPPPLSSNGSGSPATMEAIESVAPVHVGEARRRKVETRVDKFGLKEGIANVTNRSSRRPARYMVTAMPNARSGSVPVVRHTTRPCCSAIGRNTANVVTSPILRAQANQEVHLCSAE